MSRKTIQFETSVHAVTSPADLSEPGSRLGWRILLTVLLLALIIALSLLVQPAPAAHASPAQQSLSDPLVLAFYYPWFDENSWTLDRLSDLPAQPYTSTDRAAMGRQIDQAKSAGIDGFLVAWYGPGGDSNQTEPNLTALLEEAAARNFKIGILFETDSPFLGGPDSIAGALQHALSVHANQPAFLKADGRPVFFFWRPSIYGNDTWASIRGQVDPGHTALWIGEGVDTSLLSTFDGQYLYSNTWNPPADLTATDQKFAGRVDAMEQATGAAKLWVATVMPGYNDVRIRPNSGFVQDRAGGDYYAQSWQAAIASNPNWIVITSFNEWPEGTYIEPSANYGDLFLGLTANWSGQFKGGGGHVEAATLSPAVATESVTPVPEPDTPTAFVETELLNLRAGPGTTYTLLGTTTAGAQLPITGHPADGSNWWRVQTGSGDAWVFGELVRAAGPLDGVPAVEPAVEPAVQLPVEPSVAPSTSDHDSASMTLTIGGSTVNLRPVRTIP